MVNQKIGVPIPRMTTGIERVFRQITPHGQTPVLYQEFLLHFIHFMAPDGSKLSTKLDKSIPGMVYREARGDERSLYGDYTYTFPDGVTRRIIAMPPNKF